jgi:uridine nucleosidase
MSTKANKIPIWLDCDPGLDDTLAIIYAALSDRVNLVGVSTSPGNTTIHNTTRNALNILFNCGREDVPVYSGSTEKIKGEMVVSEHVHGANGLGGVKI